MPLNKYGCHTAYPCPTELLLYSTYTSHITADIIKKQQTTAPTPHDTAMNVQE